MKLKSKLIFGTLFLFIGISFFVYFFYNSNEDIDLQMQYYLLIAGIIFSGIGFVFFKVIPTKKEKTVKSKNPDEEKEPVVKSYSDDKPSPLKNKLNTVYEPSTRVAYEHQKEVHPALGLIKFILFVFFVGFMFLIFFLK